MTWIETILIITINSFLQYLVNKHFIKGLYEDRIVKHFEKKEKDDVDVGEKL